MAKIFSGTRPSGQLHLGNYLGAIQNWVKLQDDPKTTQSVYAVVDLHGITTPFDPKAYQAQVNDAVLDFLAAGVDPAKSLLIRQSHVPQHAELAWLLSTITPMGWLERLPNWREKVQQVKEMGDAGASYQNNLSLLSYPVLMAADILVYGSDLVPVGEDQQLHLELTNELATKFNFLFPGRTGGETFPKVRSHIVEGARIMSLQDPTKKMSKTGDDGIALSDDADTVRAKLKRAVTDSGDTVTFDEQSKPAISNLLTIYGTLSGKSVDTLEQQYAGAKYSTFKEELAEVVVGFLAPLQEKRQAFAGDPEKVSSILNESEEKARTIAGSVLLQAQERMGLR